jgi:hypothetical protein
VQLLGLLPLTMLKNKIGGLPNQKVPRHRQLIRGDHQEEKAARRLCVIRALEWRPARSP